MAQYSQVLDVVNFGLNFSNKAVHLLLKYHSWCKTSEFGVYNMSIKLLNEKLLPVVFHRKVAKKREQSHLGGGEETVDVWTKVFVNTQMDKIIRTSRL